MPTYEYECAKCGNHFDVFHKMSDKPGAICPKCHGKADQLIGGGAGIIFKGSGFYETDYKKKEHGKSKPSCPSQDACKGCPSNKEKK